MPARSKQVVAGKSKRIRSMSRLMPQKDDGPRIAKTLASGAETGQHDKVVTGGEQTLKAAKTLRDGSGSALLGTLLAVAVGLLVGRRLADHRAMRRTL